MDQAYYVVAGAVILGTILFGWGLRHIARPTEQRKMFIGEVGGFACLVGGILYGVAMMAFFDVVRIVAP